MALGCQKIPYFIFANNTGAPLVIVADQITVNVPVGEIRRIRFPGTSMTLLIKVTPNRNWSYNVTYPDASYIHNAKVYAQIEKDGFIYVFPTKTSKLATTLPPQPSGYPLKPN